MAVCASLTTSNIAVIPIDTPLKFVVSPISSLSSSQIQTILSSCHIFTHSFDMQIRRIFVSSYNDASNRRGRSRYAKAQYAKEDHLKRFNRSNSVNPTLSAKDDQTTTTDEGYRSGSSAAIKRDNFRKQRAVSVVSIFITKIKSIKYIFEYFLIIGC